MGGGLGDRLGKLKQTGPLRESDWIDGKVLSAKTSNQYARGHGDFWFTRWQNMVKNGQNLKKMNFCQIVAVFDFSVKNLAEKTYSNFLLLDHKAQS